MPVINHLTKRGLLISLILFGAVVIAAPLGITSAAYYNGLTSVNQPAQPAPSKRLDLVVQGKKIGLTPAELGWSPNKLDQAKLMRRVAEVADSTRKSPTDAKIIIRKGSYVISPAAEGRQVEVAKAAKMIKSGLFSGQTSIILPLKKIAPKITDSSLRPKLQQLKAEQAARAAKPAVVRRPVAPTGSCAGNLPGRKLVLISISSQHLRGCDGTRLVYSTAITSGAYLAGHATPTGTYHIYSKSRNLYLTGPGYRYFVKYWIPFYADYGFHDSSWQAFPYGSPRYAASGSHGCVHLPAAAAAWLYGWAPIGTTVTISG
jgi:hypothetical protein